MSYDRASATLATCHLPPATRHSPLATCHSPRATRRVPPATWPGHNQRHQVREPEVTPDMGSIQQTTLPGVGVRHDFTTDDGHRVGVVTHKTGRREVFVCSALDPDRAVVALNLTDDEAHDLVDLLGGSQVIESIERLQQDVEGLAIDWLTVGSGSPYDGKTIGDARIRTRTGASVVAVIRSEEHVPAPEPSFSMRADDTLLVVGTPEGVAAVADILDEG